MEKINKYINKIKSSTANKNECGKYLFKLNKYNNIMTGGEIKDSSYDYKKHSELIAYIKGQLDRYKTNPQKCLIILYGPPASGKSNAL
jgi:hypothetical protein